MFCAESLNIEGTQQVLRQRKIGGVRDEDDFLRRNLLLGDERIPKSGREHIDESGFFVHQPFKPIGEFDHQRIGQNSRVDGRFRPQIPHLEDERRALPP